MEYLAAPRHKRRPNYNEDDLDVDAREDRKRGHAEPDLIDDEGKFTDNSAKPNFRYIDGEGDPEEE